MYDDGSINPNRFESNWQGWYGCCDGGCCGYCCGCCGCCEYCCCCDGGGCCDGRYCCCDGGAGTESVLVLLAGVQSVTTFQILYLVIAIV